MYGAHSSNGVLKTALGDATFAEARSPGRPATPCFSAPAFQDFPLPFVALTANVQRYQLYVPAPAGEPGRPQSASRAQSPTWVGNPWAAAPRVRTQQRLPQAIPAEAGARGCHTCIAEPTLPPPALAQRAARPRRPQHRGWEAPGSPNQWDQSLTRSLLGLGIKDIRSGQLFISKCPSDSRQSVWDPSAGRGPSGTPGYVDLQTNKC